MAQQVKAFTIKPDQYRYLISILDIDVVDVES